MRNGITRDGSRPLSRRRVLRSLASGSIILPGLLSELLAEGSPPREAADPLAPRPPHHAPRAKRVIFCYMTGGVSHVDTFDPKPRLLADHGKKTAATRGQFLTRSPYEFRPYSSCGTEVSELFPHVGACMDDICLIRSMYTDHADHTQATLGIHTGSVSVVRPSIGSWVSFGLGTFNRNLPSFVVLAPEIPYAGSHVWGSDFLPACHQGTRVIPGKDPIPNLARNTRDPSVEDVEMGLLAALNRRHLASRGVDPSLAARIRSFDVASGMLEEAPEAFDLRGESDATLALYGLERGKEKGFGWQCITARRLAERGVRFIELIDTGSSNNWDAHGDMKTHEPHARNVDRPLAGLIQDLKARGMLNDTLVVWTTEFGRRPFADKPDHKGREHYRNAFSTWLAGGGVKGGIVHGKTDEHGIKVVENGVHVHDLHATILHILGIDHERLTYRHAGRDFRLTDVAGDVVYDILA